MPPAAATAVLIAAIGGAVACRTPGPSPAPGAAPNGAPAASAVATGPPGTAASPGVAGTLPPSAVRHEQRTFVDTGRPTPAGSATPPAPERTLVTELYLPDAGGPRPLIVFSHGLWGHPEKFSELLGRWARAGFIVAAPAFPLTNSHVPGAMANARDLWQQPGDVRFVLDRLLDADRADGDPLHGRIDRSRIAAAGLSLGGATTLGLAFNPCCREPRLAAFMVLAGNPIPLPEAYDFRGDRPILFMHGTADRSLSFDTEVGVFRSVTAPKWFAALDGAPHAPPFEDDDTPWDRYVEEVTTAFWEAHLADGGPEADRAFEDALRSAPGLATVIDP